MPRQVVELGGTDWLLGQAPAEADPERARWDELEQVAEWLPATVPGNVRADLAHAGRLPDLFVGTQAEASQWVDEHCWWLVRTWPFETPPSARVHLVIRGVDYVSDTFLNGHHLGRHEGMFSPLVRDVTGLLQPQNKLAVRVAGSQWLPTGRSSPWFRFANHLESKVTSIGRRHPHRRDTLKCQMSFGWDFAPALRTMGIWDDVVAVASEDAFIRDVEVRQEHKDGRVRLSIGIEVDARTAQPAQLRCELSGESFEAEPIVVQQVADLRRGAGHYTLDLHVPEPRLWWPWDHGDSAQYCLTVDVRDGDRCLDSITRTVGLRQVELDGWTLRINGRRAYARGANWVPAHVLPGRAREQDYSELLALARQANMNMVRVWGGGLREKRAFYETCDRLGIMVWQEFPLACAFLSRFPRSSEYLQLVEQESEAMVRELRLHPSVVLWCGGNEFNPERNRPVVNTIQRSVRKLDPTRPFLAASPSDGDSHNWKVWHGFHPPSAYQDDEALFASEFGLQAIPDKETLRQFIPPEEMWPPGPSWSYHGAELKKLLRYARPFLQGREANLDDLIEASQRAQACALQIAIEHYRRAKARGGGGVLIWQFNEPWSAISWALVDFYRRPKAAYTAVERLMSPVLVSLEYPLRRYRAGDELPVAVWLVNDLPLDLSGCQLEVALWNGAGQAVARHDTSVEIVAASASVAGSLKWTMPPGDGWRLTGRLLQGENILSENEYDLTIHDDIAPTARQRLLSWLSSLVVPS